YGKTLAIDARNGAVLWRYTPANYASWAGSAQVTTATPVADPNRQFVYAAAPDGAIRKLRVADGSVVWTTAITLLPGREKIASALNYFNGRVIATTTGYIGDAPPYQGHVALLDGAPAVLRNATGTWLFAADGGGTAAWRLSSGQLQPVWGNRNAGTSPVVVDTLLFVYDPGGGLRVYRSDTGVQLADLTCGGGHWNSPIAIDGMIALPEGRANAHATSGVLDSWRLPC